jgi:hypothetical protein
MQYPKTTLIVVASLAVVFLGHFYTEVFHTILIEKLLDWVQMFRSSTRFTRFTVLPCGFCEASMKAIADIAPMPPPTVLDLCRTTPRSLGSKPLWRPLEALHAIHGGFLALQQPRREAPGGILGPSQVR